jgi:PAS domain S-box-containing protein
MTKRNAVRVDFDPGAFSQEELGTLCRLFDALGDGLVLVDQLGIIRLCNQALEVISGYTPAELVGEPVDLLVPENVRSGHGQDRRAFLEEGALRPMGLGLDLHLLRKDGEDVPVDISLSPLRTGEGPWVSAVVRDVSARRELENERRRAAARYRSLIEQLPAAVFLAETLSGSIVYMSPQIEGISGFPPQGWIDDDLMSGTLHESDWDRVVENRRGAWEAGEPSSMEYRITAADGRTVWIREASNEIVEENVSSSYRQGILLDVTSEKAAQEGLLVSYEALQHADDQRGELLDRLKNAREEEDTRIAGDIHDDILQRVLAIAMRMGKLAPSLPELHHRLDVATLRAELLSLVGRLRTLVFEVYPPELRDGRLGAALTRMLTRVVDDTGLKLEGSVEIGELPQEVANTCYRVLQESVMNVVQHAQASRLGVFVSEGKNGIIGRVEDDGVGFDLDAPPDPSSMHLGIASMRDRVGSAGGRFRIESSPGRGTAVEFLVPLEVV